MKYVAFLRGINVGGNNIIKMTALKSCMEQQGFENVTTFIASGNVLFECDEKDVGKLTRQIEATLSKTFGYDSRIMLRSQAQLRSVLENAPIEWRKRTDLRCNIAFLREPVTASQVLPHVSVAPGIDSLKPGKGVLYMSTVLSGLKKSKFTKVIGTAIYKDLTVRTFNTCQKIYSLMERAGASPAPAVSEAANTRRDRRASR